MKRLVKNAKSVSQMVTSGKCLEWFWVSRIWKSTMNFCRELRSKLIFHLKKKAKLVSQYSKSYLTFSDEVEVVSSQRLFFGIFSEYSCKLTVTLYTVVYLYEIHIVLKCGSDFRNIDEVIHFFLFLYFLGSVFCTFYRNDLEFWFSSCTTILAMYGYMLSYILVQK